MMRKITAFLPAFFIACALSLSGHESKAASGSGISAADFFIAPNGNDRWSGKLPLPNAEGTDGPFATLARARDAVRQVIQHPRDQDVRVLIRGGTYDLARTVVFGPEDSAPDGRQITYAAFPDETPVFSSGVRIGPWKKLTVADEPPGLPAGASGHLWVADAPKQLGSFKALYDGGSELPRARGKGFQPLQSFDDPTASRSKLHFPHGALKNWANLQDVELVIRPQWPWIVNILPLASVDEATDIATTGIDGTFHLVKMTWLPPDESVWVENVIEALDQPGEWVLNTSTGKLYLWPTGATPGDNILAPALTEYVRLEGDEGSNKPVRNLILQGLTFTQGERDTWTKDEVFLESGWESYDKANALVRLRCTEKCVVKNCTFTTSATAGLRLDLRSIGNIVYGNKFEHLGGTGILLSGYGPGTTDLNKDNEVVNNEIHHIGQHYWHAPGIMLTQSSSNRIAHNLVYHVPYTAIMIAGPDPHSFRSKPVDSTKPSYIRWNEIGPLPDTKPETLLPLFQTRNNVVEFNEVHHAMEKLGDGNGIYVWFSPPGNIIRRNYVHDITSAGCVGAIRCDDYQTGIKIYENIIYRCTGIGITIKGPNYITNNIIAEIFPPGTYNAGRFGYTQLMCNYGTDTGVCQGSDLQRNIFYTAGPGVDFWSDQYDNLKDCQSDYTLYYSR
ncbi:MAG: right-handed parallel beta-helix repeat-containing protein, partial [Opitutaceae bacterium]